jgi:glycosyltransferase involved in cell wall biosynthesis
MSEVDIVIPCFNCAPWLGALVESILGQEGPSWRIIARDDGSNDETASLLMGWERRLGEKMTVLANPDKRNLGLSGSYGAVLAATTAPWVLTADPDDVWLPGHLRRVTEALRQAESELGSRTPVAICTDAAVIDGSDNPVCHSYWRWTRSNPRRIDRVADVAMESPVLASTMAVNRALLDLALPIPAGVMAQDWWFALVAVAFGRIRPLNEVSILYRRHSSNVSGVPFGFSISAALQRLVVEPAAARARLQKVLYAEASPLAEIFVERFRPRLAKKDAAALTALSELRARGPVGRRLLLLRHGLRFSSILKSCVALALC